MKHTITVRLTEEAQRAAILAGEPAQENQTYVVPQDLVAELLRLPWTKIDAEGVASCSVPDRVWCLSDAVTQPPGSPVEWNPSIGSRERLSLTPLDKRPADAAEAIAYAAGEMASAQERMDAMRQDRAEASAALLRDERAMAARWAALPLEHRATAGGVGCCRPSDLGPEYDGPLHTTGYVAYDLKIVRKHEPAAVEEAEREVERLRAAIATEKERVKTEHRRLERGLLTDYGTPNQVERFDAGVLPDEEFERVAKKALFTTFDGFPVYTPLTDGDVDHVEACDEADAKFRSDSYDGPLDAEEFDTLKRLRAVAPQGVEVEVREHTGYCRYCDAEAKRLSVRVTIEFAGCSYQRSYALS